MAVGVRVGVRVAVDVQVGVRVGVSVGAGVSVRTGWTSGNRTTFVAVGCGEGVAVPVGVADGPVSAPALPSGRLVAEA